MNKIKIYAALMMILGLAACSKSRRVVSELEGEWKLESYYGTPAVNVEVPVEVYISFSDGQFELFQKSGGGHFNLYSGTYAYDGETITGTYSDGQDWTSGYLVSFSEDGGRMTMSQYVNDEEYACVYVRTSIPEKVRRDAEDFGTKSVDAETAAVQPIL